MALLKLPSIYTPISTHLIIWVQGEGNYSWVHRLGHPSQIVAQTLKWFEDQLDHFIRISKSALVNPNYIASFKPLPTRQWRVILNNGTALVVSRRRVGLVTTQLGMSS